jgi:hypothetical protein
MKRSALCTVLLGVLAFGALPTSAATFRTGTTRNDYSTPRSSQTAQARAACESDGAVVSTALAAFDAQKPNVVPTMTALTSTAHGGPYLRNTPFNPAIYEFSISRGVLKLAVIKALGPPTLYASPINYTGPKSCYGVRVLPGVQMFLKAIAQCQADGATVATGMAAYKAEVGEAPSMSELLSSANGGPYLRSAPHNPKYYEFSISQGVLKLATVRSEGPPIVYAAPVIYRGPESCTI